MSSFIFSVVTRIGDSIDRTLIDAGLDLAGYADRSPARAKKIAIWMLAIGQTIAWAGIFYSFAALLFRWEQTLGWAKSDLTIGLTAAILASAVVTPHAGRVIDAGRGRWLLGGGLFAGAIALASLSLVQTQLAFIVVWTVIGITHGACLYQPCFSFVTRTMGDQARAAITRITLVAGFASTVSFPAAAILADLLGWRGAILCFAAVVALVGAPLLFAGGTLLECCTSRPATSAQKAQDKAAMAAAMGNPAFWLIGIAFSMMALNHGILMNHIVPLLVDRGLTEVAAVGAASVVGPMQVAGRIAMMQVEDRVGTLTLTLLSFTGALLAGLLLVMAGASQTLAFAFAALQGASYGVSSILKPVLTAERLGRQSFGTISGLLAVPGLIAFASGPYIGALLWAEGGYDLAIVVAVATMSVALTCILLLGALGQRRP